MSALKRLELVLRAALIVQLLLPTPVSQAAAVDTSTQPKDRGISPTPGSGDAVIPADPFTGASRHRFPIVVPPGTGGLAPSLALSYSSSGPLDSWVGSRWSLSVPTISRSLKRGTPTYDDADTFLLNGEELVPLGAGRYATRRESFVRITHLTGAPADDSWTLEHPDGTVLRLGTNENARIKNDAGKIFEWLVTEHEDLRGNGMTYSYDRSDPGQAYPLEIRYGLRRTPSGLTGLFVRRVQFFLEGRPDTPVSYKAGFQRLLSQRLAYVDVLVHATLVRRYDLRYVESFDSFRSLLSGVDEYGRDAASTSPPPTPPLQTAFEYTSNYDSSGSPLAGGTGWSSPVAWSWPSSVQFVTSAQEDGATRLGDVDGDGLPDLVKSYASSVNVGAGTATLSGDSGVYFSTGSGFAPKDPTWVIPPEPGTTSILRLIFTAKISGVQYALSRLLIDLTGDGRVDSPMAWDGLNANDGTFNRLAFIPWFENDGTTWIARGIAPDTIWAEGHPISDPRYHSFSRHSTGQGPTDLTIGGNARFAELNGDGLPDLVVQGAEVRVSAFDPCEGARGFSYVAINRGDFDFEQPPLTVSPSTAFIAGGYETFASSCAGPLYRTPGFYEACYPVDETCQRATFFTTTYNFGIFDFPPAPPEHQTWQHLELGNLYADVNADGLDDLITGYEDRNTPNVGSPPVLRRFAQINLGTKTFTTNSDWNRPRRRFSPLSTDSTTMEGPGPTRIWALV